jgi:hypothetical protein
LQLTAEPTLLAEPFLEILPGIKAEAFDTPRPFRDVIRKHNSTLFSLTEHLPELTRKAHAPLIIDGVYAITAKRDVQWALRRTTSLRTMLPFARITLLRLVVHEVTHRRQGELQLLL